MRSLLTRLFIYILNNFTKGGEGDMAMCYFTVIVAGMRTFKQVPLFLKEQVRELLLAAELEELIVE